MAALVTMTLPALDALGDCFRPWRTPAAAYLYDTRRAA
jgi:hypothetical protein